MHRMALSRLKRAPMFQVLPLHSCFPECVVVMFVFRCKRCQINTIKERTKAISALEREISKYVEEGKEVGGCAAVWTAPSVPLDLVQDFIYILAVAAKRVRTSRNQQSAARGRETQREGQQRDGNHPPGY